MKGIKDMSKVILVCGKICSGKTTYAKNLLDESQYTVLLSIDEIILALFGRHVGENRNKVVNRTQRYLLDKSLELINSGVSVILDWGFWTHTDRQQTSEFFSSKGVKLEWHCLDIDESVRNRYISKRMDNSAGSESDFYFVDKDTLKELDGIFEKPAQDEVDVWVEKL